MCAPDPELDPPLKDLNFDGQIHARAGFPSWLPVVVDWFAIRHHARLLYTNLMSGAFMPQAGHNRIPSLMSQLSLVGGMRWKLFRNSVHTWRGRMEAISLVIIALAISGFAVGGGVGLGILAFFCIRTGRAGWLALPFWFVFVFWQVLPLFVVASSPQFEFSNLLRFPFRFSSLFLVSLVYGVFDPFSLTACFWLGCMGFGIVLGNPAMLPWVPPILLVFALVNLVLSRVVFAWLSRWLAARRTREILGGLLLLTVLGMQLLGSTVNRLGRDTSSARPDLEPLTVRLLSLAELLPAGIAAEALTEAARENDDKAALHVALLAAYGLFFAGLLTVRLHAQYRGEDVSDERSAAELPAKRSNRPSWRLPGLSAPVAALFEKELRYFARNGPLLFALAAPFILLVFFHPSASQTLRQFGLREQVPEIMFPLASSFVLLGFMNLAFNSFAYDGQGVQLMLVAPIRFRDVLVAKNLLQVSIAAFETVAVWVAIAFIYGPPEPVVYFATLSALLFAVPVNLTIGNLVSLYFPMRRDFGVYRRKANSAVGALASLGVEFSLIIVCGLVFVIAHLHGALGLAIPLFLTLAALAMLIYARALKFHDRPGTSQREILVTQLCR
jgi:ABC-2 type transport system permease protein